MAKLNLSALKKQAATSLVNETGAETSIQAENLVTDEAPAAAIASSTNTAEAVPATQEIVSAQSDASTESNSAAEPIAETATVVAESETAEASAETGSASETEKTEELTMDATKEYFPNLSINEDIFKDILGQNKETVEESNSSEEVSQAIATMESTDMASADSSSDEPVSMEIEKDNLISAETAENAEPVMKIGESAADVAESDSETVLTSQYVQTVAEDLSKERKGGLKELFSKKKSVIVSVAGIVLTLGIVGTLYGIGIIGPSKASAPEGEKVAMTETTGNESPTPGNDDPTPTSLANTASGSETAPAALSSTGSETGSGAGSGSTTATVTLIQSGSMTTTWALAASGAMTRPVTTGSGLVTLSGSMTGTGIVSLSGSTTATGIVLAPPTSSIRTPNIRHPKTMSGSTIVKTLSGTALPVVSK